MKAAVLILAHKNIWQLERLVARLQEDFDVYIHADQKWELDVASFASYKNVFFVKRYSVNWGSYIQILATIELFKTAYLKDYDYYLLISGMDVPIKSNRYILDFMKNNKDASYINSEALPKLEWAGQGGGFDRLHYFFGIDFQNNLSGILKRKILSLTQRIQLKYGLKRKLQHIDYYGGWNWANLNRQAMSYLLNFLQEKPAFQKSFKYTYCADEIWLQTILLNSSNYIINDNLRYTIWEEHAFHPNTLTLSNLPELKRSTALFARKFDSEIDKEVIDTLYQITQ